MYELYDLRDAIDYVRIYRLMAEDLTAYKGQHPGREITETDFEFEEKLRNVGNEKTWPRVQQAVNVYKADCQEAEVLWKKDANQKLTQILQKIDELWYANRDYIELFQPQGLPLIDSHLRDRRLELIQIIYTQPPVRKDKYRTEVDEIIVHTENYLRGYLKG